MTKQIEEVIKLVGESLVQQKINNSLMSQFYNLVKGELAWERKKEVIYISAILILAGVDTAKMAGLI